MGTLMSAEIVNAITVSLLEGIGATLVLLMPGHLLRVAYDRGIRRPDQPERVFLVNTLIAAVVVHSIALPWTIRLVHLLRAGRLAAHSWEVTAWVLLVLILLPTIVGYVVAGLSRRHGPTWLARLMRVIGLSYSLNSVEAWHWFLGSGQAAYVRIRLKGDGDRTVLGYYGTRSYASSDARCRDIYLETQFRPGTDKMFGPVYGPSKGVWICGEEILTIEFFDAGKPASIQPEGSAA